MSLDNEHGIHCISMNSGPGNIININEMRQYWKGWYLTKLVGEAVPGGKGQFSLTVSDVRVVLFMELGPHGLILLPVDIKHLNKSFKNLGYISPDTLQVEVNKDSSQGHCHIHQAPQHGPTPAHTPHPDVSLFGSSVYWLQSYVPRISSVVDWACCGVPNPAQQR